MDEHPGEDELEDSRAALAPTLEATAAILPWVAKPRPLRFDEKLNERWVAAASRLSIAWSERNNRAADDVRPAIFGIYSIALETADGDCLQLGEALASAADALENGDPPTRLLAALAATIECLVEEGGLEHVLFGERARHFAQRLNDSMNPALVGSPRSPVIDHLFVGEAMERLDRMHDALAALPPDAYALKLENGELAQQAEHLELYGIVHLARQFDAIVARGDLDNAPTRQQMQEILHLLETAINAIEN